MRAPRDLLASQQTPIIRLDSITAVVTPARGSSSSSSCYYQHGASVGARSSPYY